MYKPSLNIVDHLGIAAADLYSVTYCGIMSMESENTKLFHTIVFSVYIYTDVDQSNKTKKKIHHGLCHLQMFLTYLVKSCWPRYFLVNYSLGIWKIFSLHFLT